MFGPIIAHLTGNGSLRFHEKTILLLGQERKCSLLDEVEMGVGSSRDRNVCFKLFEAALTDTGPPGVKSTAKHCELL